MGTRRNIDVETEYNRCRNINQSSLQRRVTSPKTSIEKLILKAVYKSLNLVVGLNPSPRIYSLYAI